MSAPSAQRGGPVTRPRAPRAPALDLRLLPVALTVWLACAVGVRVTPGFTVAVAALALVVAGLAVSGGRRREERCPGPTTEGARLRTHPQSGPVAGRARHRGAPAASVPATVALCCVALAAACVVVAVRVAAREADAALLPTVGTAELRVRIDSEPRELAAARAWQQTPDLRLDVTVRRVTHRGVTHVVDLPATLLAPPTWADAALGETVTVRARARRTDPGDASAALLMAQGPPTPLSAPSTRPPPHLRVAAHLRASLRDSVAGLPPQARGLVPGIAVGDDRALPTALEEDLRTTGLTHLTAVSGAHVALLLAPVLLLTGGVRPSRRAGLALAVLVGLVVLVRPEASVVRAAAMGAVTVGALLLGRPARAPASLAAAVVVLVLWDPWLATAYGFVLSALATGALALLAPVWTRGLAHVMPRWAAAALAVPAAAQVACAPVLVLLDPRVVLYAVPANLLAAPAVPPATFLGMAATVLGPVAPGVAHACAVAASWATAWIAGVATALASLPLASVPWPAGAPGAVLLAALTATGIVASPWAGRWAARWLARATRRAAGALDESAGIDAGAARLRRAALSLVVGAAVPAAGFVVSGTAAGQGMLPDGAGRDWIVVQCDVGQGAATLIRSGPDAAVLVDTGPPPDAIPRGVGAPAGVTRCLRDAGVARLDLLVLTHTHADHVGGLSDVLDEVPVAGAIVGPGPRRDAVLDRLTDAGVPVRGAGEEEQLGTTRVAILGTGRAAAEARDGAGDGAGDDDADTNDASLVVLATTPDGTRTLVAGDLGEEGQDWLLRTAGAALAGGVDIVVVPHHGSADQSAALARALAPRLALVSVGAENDYGHPTERALALYRDTGALIRRTDECGATAVVPGAEPGARDPTGALAVLDSCV